MPHSRVRNGAAQADIPTHVQSQFQARFHSFQKSRDSLESAIHAIIERVNSHQVLQAVEGFRFFHQACSDFAVLQNDLSRRYLELDSWTNVTSRDGSWGPLLLALFEPVETTYKRSAAATARSWALAFKDLTVRCFRLLSEEELTDLHARLEVELEQAQVQRAPEGQMLAGMLYAMDIDVDDNE